MTQTITLKDSHLHVIGYVDIKENGDKVLKDKNLHIKGYYDKKRDVTKDSNLHIVGYGDILTSLL